MIHTLQWLGISDRSIYLYDTFAGMTRPTVDDYGHWRGSRKATDEFLETLGSDAPLLVRTSGERVCVKLR